MAILDYFIPCQKVLLEEDSKNVTLVSILENLIVKESQTTDDDVQIGIHWNLVTHWTKESIDNNRIYQQRTYILGPEEKTFSEAVIEFKMTEETHRNTVKIFGFPCKNQGKYYAILELKSNEDDKWIEKARYGINVNFK